MGREIRPLFSARQRAVFAAEQVMVAWEADCKKWDLFYAEIERLRELLKSVGVDSYLAES